jgi:hypothetical protein
MKTIEEIVKKHIEQYTDIVGVTTATLDYPAIAREICGLLQDMMREQEASPDLIIDYYDWQAFKQANGVKE